MSAVHLTSIFTSFARRLGAEVHHCAQHPSVYYIDLEPEAATCAYVRRGVDVDAAVTVVEMVFPLSSILPADQLTLENPLALQVRASPSRSGKRFFPSLDMRCEQLSMAYLVGSEVIREEDDLASIVGAAGRPRRRLHYGL
jgi:hypothetical protein